MKLKICGVRNQLMLQSCEALGIDFIGINFVNNSKRKVNHSFCNTIAKYKKSKKVGVFRNQKIQTILKISPTWKLDIIQLHGKESAKFVHQLKSLLPSEVKIWKAFSIGENFKSDILRQYCKNCDLFLFDGKNPGSGSQIVHSRQLSEAIIESKKQNIPYGIAGGITPENIKNFKQKFPEAFLLDTASGVEENGTFSPKKLQELVANFL